jgi:hypothetical protein
VFLHGAAGEMRRARAALVEAVSDACGAETWVQEKRPGQAGAWGLGRGVREGEPKGARRGKGGAEHSRAEHSKAKQSKAKGAVVGRHLRSVADRGRRLGLEQRAPP